MNTIRPKYIFSILLRVVIAVFLAVGTLAAPRLSAAAMVNWTHWTTSSTAWSQTTVRGIALGPASENYVIGSHVLLGAGGQQAFLAALDPGGNFMWEIDLGVAGIQDVRAVVTDLASGEIYVAGSGATSFSPTGQDGVVARFTPAGGLVWTTYLASALIDQAKGLAFDAVNNVLFVTGYMDNSLITPVPPLTPHSGSRDAFLVAMDLGGTIKWHTFMGCAGGMDAGNAVAVNMGGEVVVTGISECSWGMPVTPFAGATDAFVAKFDPIGNPHWNTFAGSPMKDRGTSVAMDPNSGEMVVGGVSEDSWGKPVSPFVPKGANAFVVKLGPGGNQDWNTFFYAENIKRVSLALDPAGYTHLTHTVGLGTSSDAGYVQLDRFGVTMLSIVLGAPSAVDSGRAIALDSLGVHLAGAGGANWGPPLVAHSASSTEEAFVALLDANIGSFGLKWNTFLTNMGSGCDTHETVLLDKSSGYLYVVGSLISGSNSDVCIAEVHPTTGAVIRRMTFGGVGEDVGLGISRDGAGYLYVSGYSTRSWGSPKVAFGTGASINGFVAKIQRSSGTLVWNTFTGGTKPERLSAVAAYGAAPVIYAVGEREVNGTLGRDILALSLNASGNKNWQYLYGSATGDDAGYAIMAAPNGYPYIAASSNAAWGGGSASYKGDYDAVLVSLTPGGTLLRNTFIGSAGTDWGLGLTIDTSGSVYLTGQSDTTWGAPKRSHDPTPWNSDAFVAKFTPQCVQVWNTFLGGAGWDTGWGLAVENGLLYVSGTSDASWGTSSSYVGSNDSFVAILNASSGIFSRNDFIGSADMDFGYGIVASSGTYYVVGTTYSSSVSSFIASGN